MPTIDENREHWGAGYDWSKLGEEWTPDERWRKQILANGMEPYLEAGAHVLEIGPGGGRWTEPLLERHPARLVGVDLSPTCVDLCRERFGADGPAEFHANDGKDLSFLEDESFDFVWSFDVFVHMEADIIEGYFAHFARLMKPGAVGVIHYPSVDRAPDGETYKGWRGHYTSTLMDALTARLGFEMLYNHFDPHISSSNSSIVVFRK